MIFLLWMQAQSTPPFQVLSELDQNLSSYRVYGQNDTQTLPILLVNVGYLKYFIQKYSKSFRLLNLSENITQNKMPDGGIITTKLQITCKLKPIMLKTYISFSVLTIHHTSGP